MKKNILIVGGSSGVGQKLARHYVTDGHTVCITGRKNPNLEGARFQPLAITENTSDLIREIDQLAEDFPIVNTLIYAAGYLQRGHIDDLGDGDLQTMVNVGLLAPMMLVQRLKRSTSNPLKIMLITSSSQYTPREFEPAYCATKSGLGMLGAALVRDGEIGKVLVVAPSRINTPFWVGTDENTETMLDPEWVADQIIALSSGAFKYKYAKLFRNPARSEIVECLDNSFHQI
ncbi:SDR family NAD(P)-dependent oxidoreductase [Shimia sp. MMG029]|uniref:SDR family NAD(P)-dependent oxidoreductase n=1 Tax=Shimia sp. MMG029 TaxID=3021978 RepID=UPI0022FF1EC6|nr:SDR family oxidoreductase [Shimia sp. MMG029]MDA5555504.1 SDR family NAD(P)-dependent oxidoreductase [Shimia sp. MMG029]